MDVSLRFCLSDGASLSVDDDSEETVVIDRKHFPNETQIKFPLELIRAYSLFVYETDGGRESVLWNEPQQFNRLSKEHGADFINKYNFWKRK